MPPHRGIGIAHRQFVTAGGSDDRPIRRVLKVLDDGDAIWPCRSILGPEVVVSAGNRKEIYLHDISMDFQQLRSKALAQPSMASFVEAGPEPPPDVCP